ncbi:MAG: hypothetical protein OJF49_000002 [Ktedonobacterales bacterium]|nr:MAG: hypothetical protein OJF49_000002 [Ktedonobacterales bacterium]
MLQARPLDECSGGLSRFLESREDSYDIFMIVTYE